MRIHNFSFLFGNKFTPWSFEGNFVKALELPAIFFGRMTPSQRSFYPRLTTGSPPHRHASSSNWLDCNPLAGLRMTLQPDHRPGHRIGGMALTVLGLFLLVF
jgi:hypothetical protein